MLVTSPARPCDLEPTLSRHVAPFGQLPRVSRSVHFHQAGVAHCTCALHDSGTNGHNVHSPCMAERHLGIVSAGALMRRSCRLSCGRRGGCSRVWGRRPHVGKPSLGHTSAAALMRLFCRLGCGRRGGCIGAWVRRPHVGEPSLGLTSAAALMRRICRLACGRRGGCSRAWGR